MARLAAKTARKSRSKPLKTISTTRIFGKAVDGDGEGLNGDGLSGDRLDGSWRQGAKDIGLSGEDRGQGAGRHKADGGWTTIDDDE
jgi:hypothetical protein